jgi:hypothetical protein
MTNDKIFDEVGCPEKLKECKAEVKRCKKHIEKLEEKENEILIIKNR